METSSSSFNLRDTIYDFAQTILMSVAIFLVVYIFLFRPFEVSGSSMHPNYLDNEFILASIIGLSFSPPQRGDVIVFHPPVAEPGKDFYIKRIIAIPSDTIRISQGDVYINGEKLDQSSFLSSEVKTFPGAFLKENETVTIPKDSYFVMGDNRANSSDSREWGFISKNEIIGKSLLVYWPPQEIKLIGNPLQ